MAFPKNPAVSSASPTPLFFTDRNYGVYLPGAGTLGCAVWPGVGLTHSQGMFPDFYPSHVDGGPPLPIPPLPPPPLCTTHLLTSPPLLPVWMNVASLNPWLWNFI